MQTFWKQLLAALAAGRETELVTVLAASGSTPRGTGAVMAVWPDGASAGTIGGGNVEFEAVKLARALLKDRADDLRQFRFLPGDATSLGMVCGGDVTLQFQYLAPGAPAAAALDLAVAGAARGERWWLVRQIRDGRVTAAEAVGPDGSPSLPEELFQARAVCCDDRSPSRYPRQGPSISSAADTSPRRWCRCWPRRISGCGSMTTARNSPMQRGSPRRTGLRWWTSPASQTAYL